MALGAGAGVERNLIGQRNWFALWQSPAALWRGLATDWQAAIETRRGFLMLPFAVILGLLVYSAVPTEPTWIGAGLPLFASLVWLIIAFLRRASTNVPLLVCGLVFGFALLPVHGALNGTDMLANARYGTYRAEVETVLDATQAGQRVILGNIVALDGRGPEVRRARLFIRDGGEIAAGDVIEGRMRFDSVPGPAVPGGYDAQFHGYFDGIGAYGTALGAPEVVAQADAGLAGMVARVRAGIGRRIDAVLSGQEAAVARALSIGDQSRIPDETRDQMAIAGIAHVLAISGLHLTLVAGGAFAAMRLVLAVFQQATLRLPIKKIAAGAGILTVLVYLSISGASVSAVRASVMLILVFGAMLAGRRALTMRNVAFAALFVLVAEPASLFRPGFQLSFAAVAALIGVYEHHRPASMRHQSIAGRVWRFVVGLSVTSLVAGLATAVFAAYHFQQTAPLGLAGNLVALPLLAFVVLPSLALSVLAMPLGFEAPLLLAAGTGITLILDAAHAVATASALIAYRPLLEPITLVIALAAAVWFVFFTTWRRYLGPVFAGCLIVVFGPAPLPDVLIADRTQAVGVRNGQVLTLMSGRAGSFATDVWADTYGLVVQQKGDAVACDDLACIGTLENGAQVSAIRDLAGFFEDCELVDLVIARVPAPDTCRELTEVIDQTDLERGGVTAAYWDAPAQRFTIAPSITDPERPWRARR